MLFSLKQAIIVLPEHLAQFNSSICSDFVLITQRVNQTLLAQLANINTTHIKAILSQTFDPRMDEDLMNIKIMPLEFKFGMSVQSIQINGQFDGEDRLDILSLSKKIKPSMDFLCRFTRKSGFHEEFIVKWGMKEHSRYQLSLIEQRLLA